MGVDLLNIKGLRELDQAAPVVMLNLMRFRERSLDGDGSGWDAYLRYSALTVPMIKARGGTLLWTGNAKAVALGAEHGNQWDYVALVYYPTLSAFTDMMTSPDYETLSDPHRRTAAPSTSSSARMRPTASSSHKCLMDERSLPAFELRICNYKTRLWQGFPAKFGHGWGLRATCR